jgi:hypothetical protein
MTRRLVDTISAHVATEYEPGAILEYSWGYDQTNIDYFMVTKRTTSPKGAVNLTLVPMTTEDVVETGFMSGRCSPGMPELDAKPVRRKLHQWGGQERGVAIRSYGWCSLWDGSRSNWSSYA